MAARINISIPEDLQERLSHFKGMLKVSRICQEAINHAVRIEEIKAEAPSIDSLAERLQAEELKWGKEYIDEGFEYGIKDAYGLSLENFLDINRSRSSIYPYKLEGSAPFIPSEETNKALEDLWERAGPTSERKENEMETTPGVGYMLVPVKYFIRGWIEGVIHIWDKVKGDLIGFVEECEEEEREYINYIDKTFYSEEVL
jgi:hypothetical protein